MKERAYKGTDVKMRLQIEADGFTMHDNDFSITLYQGTIVKRIPKKDFVEEIDDGAYNYYFCFETRIFNKGVICATVEALVPDNDFPNGIRREVDKFELLIVE